MLWSTSTTVRPPATCLISSMVRSTSSSAHAGGRLVEQEQLGVERQREGQLQGPLLAVGEAIRPAAPARSARPTWSSSSRARSAELAASAWPTARTGSRARSATAGRARRARRRLSWSNRLVIWKDRATPRWAICSGCSPVMSCAANRIWPERRREEAGEQVEQRGLAGAVGADQRVHAALGDAQVDVGDGAEAAELLGQRAGLEQDPAAEAGVAGHTGTSSCGLSAAGTGSRFCRTLGPVRAPDMAGSSTQMHQIMSVAHIAGEPGLSVPARRGARRPGCRRPGRTGSG